MPEQRISSIHHAIQVDALPLGVLFHVRGRHGHGPGQPLYPIYQQAWGLQPSHITQIFVAYMFGALASLLFLGRLTDRFGFLAVLRAGLVLMTLGITSSALAWNVPSFAICRFVIGVASGLITTSASVGMTQLNNKGDLQRAAATTSLTIAFGFGLGPVVGGLMAQWLPMPLKTAYLPSILLGFLAIYALFQVRIPASTSTSTGGLSFRDVMPALSQPRRPFLRHYMLGCMAAFSAFGMFSLFAALAPSFMQNMVPGTAPGLGLVHRHHPVHVCRHTASGTPCRHQENSHHRLLCAGRQQSLADGQYPARLSWLFALSVLTTATGHAMCNLAGMSIVNKVSKPANRTGLLSTYLIIGYLGTIVPILGLGWLSDVMGLTPALVVFCLCLSVLTTVLGVFSLRARVLPIPRQ